MKRDLDKYHLMKVFNAVALEGSFTNAATRLNMTVSSVSKAVNQLEAVLGSRLLNRTTRKQSLTDAGRIYIEHSLYRQNVFFLRLSMVEGFKEFSHSGCFQLS